LTSKDVVFPGNPPVEIAPMLSMEHGDSCNTWTLKLFNHNGTHLDCPNHYQRRGRNVADYTMDELVFTRPYIVDLPRGNDEAIEAADLMNFLDEAREADLLFLRTGFGVHRGTPTYVFGPYLTEGAGEYLRKMFPQLRCLALDCLSATNPNYRVVGEEVHRILLAEEPDKKPVLILEDVNLRHRERIMSFCRVFVVPLFVEGLDGMSCTVFGEVEP
jgi:kynurenine formamidase